MACDEEEILGTNALRSPSPQLRVVVLAGKLEKVPLWFHSLRNLTCLYLHWSRLEEDLLPCIEALPCLVTLTLINSYVGKELCFGRGFVKLTELYLLNFPLTNKMTIEKGVMPNLKYFQLGNWNELKTLPLGLEYLTTLQQLHLVNLPIEIIDRIRKGAVDRPKVQHIPEIIHKNGMQSSEGDFIRLVGNMKQLTRIGISNVKKSDEMYLCDSIQKLQLHNYLFLMACDEEELLGTNALSSPSPQLRVVYLVGKLERVPPWFHSLRNLTHLGLHWSRLEEDLLPCIADLPCLGYLTLANSYVGKELCFCRGFVKLAGLVLRNFPLMNKITIQKGVMPNLKSLSLGNFIELKILPLGLEYLSNLQQLHLLNLPMEIIEPIRKGAVDHPKIQHIPEINHYNIMQSGGVTIR
ncbi:hypothetical protein M0R45_031292 [Rubus argutus]|uniref:Disease resistance R13L4/SHOC-2-like LRR domain-containing protein n=1 Tax=Rubus argutus TaxID=59490 RepID=A0AAW1WG47_RUBAR